MGMPKKESLSLWRYICLWFREAFPVKKAWGVMEWTTAPTGVAVALISWFCRNSMSQDWKNVVDSMGNGFVPIATCVLYVAFRVMAAPYFVWKNSCQIRDEKISSLVEERDKAIRDGGPNSTPPTPEILATVEAVYHTVDMMWKNGEQMEYGQREVFAAKVRNQGTRSIYVEDIGFLDGQTKYLGKFHPYSSKDSIEARNILPGRSQIFSFFNDTIDTEQMVKMDGMYVVIGSGDEFVNRNADLKRVIRECEEESLQKRETEIKAVREAIGQLLLEGNQLLIFCREEDRIKINVPTFSGVPYAAEQKCIEWNARVVEILTTHFGESYANHYHLNFSAPEAQSTSSDLTRTLHARLTELLDLSKNEQRWPANLRPLKI
jgi:hypothetical protein